MGRDAGRHADGDARRAVGQEVGKAGRQDDRFFFLAIVGFAEVGGVLINAFKQRPGEFCQPRLGIAHGGGVIAVYAAEIALSVDQGIALREILGEADQCVVNGDVAVGMVFTNNIADHTGAFLEARMWLQLELAHRIEEPSLHRFQAVADVGQGAGHDGGKGIIEITLTQGVSKTGLKHFVRRRGMAHFGSLTAPTGISHEFGNDLLDIVANWGLSSTHRGFHGKSKITMGIRAVGNATAGPA